MKMLGAVDIIDLANTIWTICVFCAGIFAKICFEARRKYKFKRILAFKRNKHLCSLSIPRYNTEILDVERDVMMADEVEQLISIDQQLAKIGVTSELLGEYEGEYDEIHIGGPSVNAYTNRCFYRYLENVKWKIRKDREIGYQKYDNRDGFNFDYIQESSDDIEGFIIGDSFYEFIPGKKGWAIIIKITDDKDIVPKVIHLLFGAGANGTIGAVRYFSKHHGRIYDQCKNRDYFGIFEVDKDGFKVGEIKWLDINQYLKAQEEM